MNGPQRTACLAKGYTYNWYTGILYILIGRSDLPGTVIWLTHVNLYRISRHFGHSQWWTQENEWWSVRQSTGWSRIENAPPPIKLGGGMLGKFWWWGAQLEDTSWLYTGLQLSVHIHDKMGWRTTHRWTDGMTWRTICKSYVWPVPLPDNDVIFLLFVGTSLLFLYGLCSAELLQSRSGCGLQSILLSTGTYRHSVSKKKIPPINTFNRIRCRSKYPCILDLNFHHNLLLYWFTYLSILTYFNTIVDW